MKRIFFLLVLMVSTHNKVFCQVRITGGTYITTAGTVHIIVADLDFENKGVLDATGSTFHFTGTGNNNLSGDITTFDNIIINKTTGKQLGLNTMIYVNSAVNFISGNIDLKDQTIYLGNTGSFMNEAENARAFSSTGGGSVNATRFLDAPNAVNIGNLGATITAGWNLGNVSVTRAHYTIDVAKNGGKSILRSFEFNNSNAGTGNVLLKFGYFDAELNGANENGLTLFQTTDNNHYTNKSFASKDPIANSLIQTVSNMLSKFTLSNDAAAGALPVVLTGFTAQCKNNLVRLNWNTSSEINSDHFDIQRSYNGAAWQRIGAVHAAGNSNSMIAYQYDDNTLNDASAFYRLAQYDADGKVAYSSIQKSGCGLATAFTVMPNPVQAMANVVIGGRANGKASLILYNASGQLVMERVITVTAGINQFQIDMQTMAKGNYNLLFIENGEIRQQVKMIKQ